MIRFTRPVAVVARGSGSIALLGHQDRGGVHGQNVREGSRVAQERDALVQLESVIIYDKRLKTALQADTRLPLYCHRTKPHHPHLNLLSLLNLKLLLHLS